jgi:hypothetical protein
MCSEAVSAKASSTNDAVEKCDEFIGRKIGAQHAVELGADFRGIHSLCSECPHDSLNVSHEKRGSENQDLLLLEEFLNGTASHLVERHCGRETAGCEKSL